MRGQASFETCGIGRPYLGHEQPPRRNAMPRRVNIEFLITNSCRATQKRIEGYVDILIAISLTVLLVVRLIYIL